jgi:hypothetical protein
MSTPSPTSARAALAPVEDTGASSGVRSSACEIRDGLVHYLHRLPEFAADTVHHDWGENLLARNLSAGTVLAVGCVCAFGPVLLGRQWFVHTLRLFVGLTSAVGMLQLLEGPLNGVATVAQSMLDMDEDGECLYQIIVVLFGASLGSCLVAQLFAVVVFAAGAFLAGAGASAMSGAITQAIGKTLPDIKIEPWHVWAAIGTLAVLGGGIFSLLVDEVLELVLGAIGSVLIANALFELLLTNIGSHWPSSFAVETAFDLNVNTKVYVLTLAAIVFLLRVRFATRKRVKMRDDVDVLIMR